MHILRDGRDVALSHQTMPYGSGNIAECAEAWVRRTTTNAKMGRILGPDRYFALRYEDLILDTRPTLERLCAFLGVAFSEQMLRYGEMVDEKVPEDRRWLWPALNKPPEKSKVGRWRHEMSPTQRIVFEGIANDGRTQRMGSPLPSFGLPFQIPLRVSAHGTSRGSAPITKRLSWNLNI